METLERSLADHWDRSARPFIDSLAYKWGTNLIAPIAVTLVLVVCFAATRPVGILLALLVGGVWGLVLYNQAQAAEKRRQDVRNLLERGKQDSLQKLRGAGAEVVDWSGAFKQADGREPAVRALIADLAKSASPAHPHERRVADTGARTGA